MTRAMNEATPEGSKEKMYDSPSIPHPGPFLLQTLWKPFLLRNWISLGMER